MDGGREGGRSVSSTEIARCSFVFPFFLLYKKSEAIIRYHTNIDMERERERNRKGLVK